MTDTTIHDLDLFMMSKGERRTLRRRRIMKARVMRHAMKRAASRAMHGELRKKSAVPS